MAQTRVPESFGKLDDDALMSLWTVVGEEAAERREQSRRIAAEVEERQLRSAALERVRQLPDAERDALAQAVAAVGIESQEKVSDRG